jgi:hypothetical protein
MRLYEICRRTVPVLVVNDRLRLPRHGMTFRTLGQRCDSTQRGSRFQVLVWSQAPGNIHFSVDVPTKM